MEHTLATAPITLTNIVRVYRGKPGCMCGCNGRYHYPRGTDKAKMDAERGYAGTVINQKKVEEVFAAVSTHPETKVEKNEFKGGEFIAYVLDKRDSYNRRNYYVVYYNVPEVK